MFAGSAARSPCITVRIRTGAPQMSTSRKVRVWDDSDIALSTVLPLEPVSASLVGCNEDLRIKSFVNNSLRTCTAFIV